MAKFGFDTKEVDVNERGSFDPIPEGEYTLKATDAEEKQTKAGTGSYIATAFEVVKGQYAGRKVWLNFNINNPSEKAQKIGRQQLVSWATAAGKPDADDTDKLLGVPFSAAVGIEPARDGYAARNEIKAFLFTAVPGSPAPKPPAPTKPSPAAAKGKGAANPWD